MDGGRARVAVVMLHGGCDLVCNFCITGRLRCLDFDEVLRLLESLSDRDIRNVVLGGGEPLVWPHGAAALARRARSMGFFVQIGTNGLALPEGFERLDCFDRYVLPLESADAAVHDSMRVAGVSHHGVILDRLERLRGAGKSVTVSTVVTRWNLRGLARTARFLARYREAGGNLHAWHLYRFLPRGRGGSVNARLLSISREAYHRACDEVRSASPRLRIFKRPDMVRSRTVEFHGSGCGQGAVLKTKAPSHSRYGPASCQSLSV